MSNPENTTTFKIYTGDGTTVAYTMTSRITDTTDIEVYVDEVKQTSGVTVTYNTTTFLVTVTFATAPANASTILIFRNTQAKFQNITPGSGITSDSINAIFNNDYLSIYDRDNISDRFSLRYKTGSLSDGTGPTTAQLEIPLPTAPSAGFDNVQLSWNGTSFAWEDSTSVANFKADLASTTDPQGASLIGYNNGSATTVQAQLDRYRQEALSPSGSGATYIPAKFTYNNTAATVQQLFDNLFSTATSTTSGASYVSAWWKTQATASNVQSLFDTIFTAATDVNTSGALYIPVWDANRATASDIQTSFNYVFAPPTVSNTAFGAGSINYWNGTASVTIKSALDDVFETSTSASTGGATHIEAWYGGAANSIQGVIDSYTNTAATSATSSGAYNITYWNGLESISIQSQLDSMNQSLNNVRQYGIGDFISGIPVNDPSGSWLLIKDGESIGPSGSTATYANNAYEDLFIYIEEAYNGRTNAQAQANWATGTINVSPSSATIAVSGPNTWRYA